MQKDVVIIKTIARDNSEFEIREGLRWSSSLKRSLDDQQQTDR